MSTPILPPISAEIAAEAEALWAERDRRVAALNDRQAAAVLAVCHDAELAAGRPEWAHLLDDDRPFYALAARATYTTQEAS